MKSKVIISTLALGAIITAGVVGIRTASADDFSNPVVERLAERFDLNEDEVQAVFDAVRDEKHAEMQVLFEERLDELVSDGTLTEEQKQAFLDKRDEMRSGKGEYRDLSHEERMAVKEANRVEMQVWAEENGIDLSVLKQELGKGMGRGFKAGHHFGIE
jgi:hypothetical protein